MSEHAPRMRIARAALILGASLSGLAVADLAQAQQLERARRPVLLVAGLSPLVEEQPLSAAPGHDMGPVAGRDVAHGVWRMVQRRDRAAGERARSGGRAGHLFRHAGRDAGCRARADCRVSIH